MKDLVQIYVVVDQSGKSMVMGARQGRTGRGEQNAKEPEFGSFNLSEENNTLGSPGKGENSNILKMQI